MTHPRPTVLVIDDDQTMRRFIRAVLEREGHEVIEAANGKEGLALFRSRPVNCLIVDIFMPDKDGLETIMELRNESAECRILAMSGGGSLGDMSFLDYSRAFGAQSLLRKPFTPDELTSAVRGLLDTP